MKKLMAFVVTAVLSFATELKFINLVPESEIIINNKVYTNGSKKVMSVDLKDRSYDIVIKNKNYLPLRFSYDVNKNKNNIILVNVSDKYKLTPAKNYYKVLKINYYTLSGFDRVYHKDFCKKFKCQAKEKKSFIGFYDTDVQNFVEPNLYRFSNKSPYKYVKLSADSDDTYSTSVSTDTTSNEIITLNPVTAWSKLTLEIGAASLTDKDAKDFKGYVVGVGYRKNLPVDFFFSLRARYLNFTQKDTNATISGYQYGGGIGHLFNHGIMLEGGILKNTLKGSDGSDYKKSNITPYAELSFKNLRIHYSTTDMEASILEPDLKNSLFYFTLGYADTNEKFIKEKDPSLHNLSTDSTNSDGSSSLQGGVDLAAGVQTSGTLFADFSIHYLNLSDSGTYKETKTYYWGWNNSYTDTETYTYTFSSTLSGTKYGVGLGLKIRLSRKFSLNPIKLYLKGGVFKNNLTLKIKKENGDVTKYKINNLSPYGEIAFGGRRARLGFQYAKENWNIFIGIYF